LVVDRDVLSDRRALETLVVEIQRRYATRQPTVYALDVPAAELSATERTEDPPHELGGDFTFLEERLIKALWHNSYDATSGDLIWWWARKAETLIGAEEGGEADAILSDGKPVWIDGGPRQPLELDRPVIHHPSPHRASSPSHRRSRRRTRDRDRCGLQPASGRGDEASSAEPHCQEGEDDSLSGLGDSPNGRASSDSDR
jgi:hypothetical protein